MLRVLALAILLNSAAFSTDFSANTDNSSSIGNNFTAIDPALLCTPYFIYWATWLGNVYGIFDAIGWTSDWISAYLFYIIPDNKVVVGIKNKIKEHQKAEQDSHKQQLLAAAGICDSIANSLEHGESNITKEQILHCIKISHECLTQEIQDEDHQPICLNHPR